MNETKQKAAKKLSLEGGKNERQEGRHLVSHSEQSEESHYIKLNEITTRSANARNDMNNISCASTDNNYTSKKKAAFTLAEVLITLGIIGVVAAVTMPILITNYQKHVTVTQLKKAYTDFAQAMQKAESDHGIMETWNFADFDTAQDRATYFGENYLFPYIKTIKKCIPTSNECWADNVMALGTSTANSLVNSDNAHVSFVTASGYSGYYWLHASGTGLAYWVDLNGKKGPNRVGKDIFYFQANWGNTGYKQGCYPVGAHEKTSYTREQLLSGLGLSNNRLACKKSTSYYNGYVCSALIMLDGWKIEKDYPW